MVNEEQNPYRTVVTDAPERSRFEISVDGRTVGFARYRHRAGRLEIPHTEVDPAHRGRGLAAEVTRATLEAARERDLTVVPLCSYVAAYIRRHPEFLDLVDADHRDLLG